MLKNPDNINSEKCATLKTRTSTAKALSHHCHYFDFSSLK